MRLDFVAAGTAMALAGIVDRIGAGDTFAAVVLFMPRPNHDSARREHAGLALAVLRHSLPHDAAPSGRARIHGFLAVARMYGAEPAAKGNPIRKFDFACRGRPRQISRARRPPCRRHPIRSKHV